MRSGYEGYQLLGPGILQAPEQPRPGNLVFSADEAVMKVRKWVRECLSDHPACSSGGYAPMRLLDLVDGPKCEKIRLIDTWREFSFPYVALSHCWGNTHHAITTKANLAQRKHFVSYESLSPTFQDAIWITARLGLRYLWIDSLCIVQDDPHDWKKQASDMYRLYSAAYLTIAASHGVNGNAGVFPSSETPEPIEYTDVITDSRNVRYNVEMVLNPVAHLGFDNLVHQTFSNSKSYEMATQEPLTTRGWAFQERALSARIVHFTSQELIWECRSRRFCNCGAINEKSTTTGLMGSVKRTIQPQLGVAKIADYIDDDDMDRSETASEDHNRGSMLIEEPMQEWKRLIRLFTKRKLTKLEDRAAAFAGIAQTFGSIVNAHSWDEDLIGEFCAGLWSKGLPYVLLWSCATDSVMKKPESCHGYRIKNTMSPSWSWYSVDGAPSFFDMGKYDFDGYGFKYVKKFKEMGCNFRAYVDGEVSHNYLNGGKLDITNATLLTVKRSSHDRPFYLLGRNGRVHDSGTVYFLADDQDDQDFHHLVCLCIYIGVHYVPVYGWPNDDDVVNTHDMDDDKGTHVGELAHAHPDRAIAMGMYQYRNLLGCRQHCFGVALTMVGDPRDKTFRRIGLFHVEGNSCTWNGGRWSYQSVHKDDVPPSCSFQEDFEASCYRVGRIVLV